MTTKQKVKLDWKKLLGFKLAAANKSEGLSPANLAKVGDKMVGGKVPPPDNMSASQILAR